MSFLPKINLRRTLLIARRDYLGYIKTWGFWISFFLPFVFGIIGFAAAQLDFDFTPLKYETILDETGQHAAGIEARLVAEQDRRIRRILTEIEDTPLISKAQGAELKQRYETGGLDAVKAYLSEIAPGSEGQLNSALERLDVSISFIAPPAETLDALTPYLRGEKMAAVEGQLVRLNGALIIRADEEGEAAGIDYWSTNFNNPKAQRLAEGYFKDRAEEAYLSRQGLTKAGLDAARKGSNSVNLFNPTKAADATGEGQGVTITDRVPYYAAAALSLVLWFTVFSGSYMLLTSMLEEKLNKLLEMMLASTRFSEIIFGKLIGVAALTITALAPYILLMIVGVVGYIIIEPDPEIAAGLKQAFTLKIVTFFVVFLVLGYVFYGALFIALGSLSQSMQDAQTLTTPIVLILTMCIMVVPVGLENPDSPILRIASFFPLSAPFAMIVRLPSDPPLWEVLLSAGVLALVCLFVVFLAGRIFQFGVLSGSGVSAVTGWFKRTVLRRRV